MVAGDGGDRVCTHARNLFVNSRMERNSMLQIMSRIIPLDRKSFVRFVAPVLFAFFLGSSAAPTFAQQPGQRTFASAEDAGRAFLSASRARDEQALLSILGPDGKAIISSGDPTEDVNSKIHFVNKYEEMHRFATEPNGTLILFVGAENWPLPIPLVNNHGSWYFDTPAGKQEILFRRIGVNELTAMDACSDLVEAQKQYFTHPASGGSKQFAQKLVSDEGQDNGLYSHQPNDGFDVPLNPLIAYAYGNGPKDKVGKQIPFYGYFFRILTSQGSHASGGAKNYVVGGKMTEGFAFVAYPAEYRSSGVMTFVVDESGTIYEKDLGPDTAKLAEAMTAYDPDSTWNKAE
jgi:hypothetical protein